MILLLATLVVALMAALAAHGSAAQAQTAASSGTVVAWGFNGSGQLNVPSGLTDVKAIAGGGYHSLALVDPNPPGPVDTFDAEAGEERVSLSWMNPSDADFRR